MKTIFFIFTLLCTAVSFAMQPAQWFRDVAPTVQEELRAEDAEAATYELILLSRNFDDPAVNRNQMIQKVERLLKRGANANAAYKYQGITERKKRVISQAIPYFPEIVELLLRAGADPNSPAYEASVTKASILFQAIQKNNVRIVTSLLRYGADPNFITEPPEQTPLFDAITKGNPEIIRLLLQAGANPNWETNMRQITNTSNRQLKMLNEILKRNESPEDTSIYPTPLEFAQQKLNEAQNEAEKQSYRAIVQMLEHPRTITRTGLEKIPITTHLQKKLDDQSIEQEVERIKVSEQYKKSAQEAAKKHLEELKKEKQRESL